MKQKLIAGPVEGYKIVNDDLTCRGVKFDVGKIVELGNDEPLKLCANGFHFCKYPSGVWSYYEKGRVFKIRAYDVLDLPVEPGAEYKLVCRKVELVEEIKIGGYRNTGNMNTGNMNTGYSNTGNMNTGNMNTGDRNTGYRNTGDRNTGDSNTGDRNTGYRNTGYRNTGYRNTGDSNTGNMNTGYRNTGNMNTGNMNTGDSNTGNMNTGYRNTGIGNCCNGHSGYFSIKALPIVIFDKPTKKKIDDVLANKLANLLSSDDVFDVTPFLTLPNATKAKIKALHKKHIEARKKLTNR